MKVSVLVMTYNHVDFIEQALKSVLMQRATFDYEIIVSEDCSVDGTREIVLEYQRRYPKQIRVLLSEENIRSNFIVTRGIQAAEGQYIALLDGDDYWTIPDKLQKQVEFLDSHPNCAICFHNVRVLDESNGKSDQLWNSPSQKPIATFEDIWMGNFIATCSTMFRQGIIGEIPGWYETMFPITDWPLHILNAEHGNIGYLDEVMGVYRFHGGGCYSTFPEKKKLTETMNFYKSMNEHLQFKYDKMIRTALSKYFFEWTEEYLKRGDLDQARSCFRFYVSGRPLNRFISIEKLVKIFLLLYVFPGWGRRGKPARGSTFLP